MRKALALLPLFMIGCTMVPVNFGTVNMRIDTLNRDEVVPAETVRKETDSERIQRKLDKFKEIDK